MKINLHRATLCLPQDCTLELDDARGTRIDCHRGMLWITQEHDRADVVVPAGEAFTVSRGGRTLVHALKPAQLLLEAPERRPRVFGLARWPFAMRGAPRQKSRPLSA